MNVLLLNSLFIWLILFNFSSLFVTLFPPSNSTRCFSEDSTIELDRWLYRITLINLVVIFCLTALFNLILWLLWTEEKKDEEEDLQKYYHWLTTYFPMILLTVLYLVGCMVILVKGVQILADCQYNSISSLFASVHCLNIFLLFLVTGAIALRPLFQLCQERCYQ